MFSTWVSLQIDLQNLHSMVYFGMERNEGKGYSKLNKREVNIDDDPGDQQDELKSVILGRGECKTWKFWEGTRKDKGRSGNTEV